MELPIEAHGFIGRFERERHYGVTETIFLLPIDEGMTIVEQVAATWLPLEIEEDADEQDPTAYGAGRGILINPEWKDLFPKGSERLALLRGHNQYQHLYLYFDPVTGRLGLIHIYEDMD